MLYWNICSITFEYKFDEKFDNVKEEFVNMCEINETVAKLETKVVTLKNRISKLEIRNTSEFFLWEPKTICMLAVLLCVVAKSVYVDSYDYLS